MRVQLCGRVVAAHRGLGPWQGSASGGLCRTQAASHVDGNAVAARQAWRVSVRTLFHAANGDRVDSRSLDPSIPSLQDGDSDTVPPKRLSFYNRNIRDMANKAVHRLSVKDLWELAEASDPLRESAQMLNAGLLPRIGQRLLQFQRLPFIAGSNPYIKHVHLQYAEAFQKLFAFRARAQQSDFSNEYTTFLRSLVEPHLRVARIVARGLAECVAFDYITPENAHTFMNDLIRSRISIRLLLEHHLALLDQRKERAGIIDLKVHPLEVARECEKIVAERCAKEFGRAPGLVIDGQVDFHVAHFRHHLKYILLELLKNAYEATARKHTTADTLPPVRITMSHSTSFFTIRVSDQGGGIRRDDEKRVWLFSFRPDDIKSTQQRLTALTSTTSLRGLGVGLPMSRLYAEYIDGGLDVKSVHGYGADAFLTLPCLEAHQEHQLD